MLYCWVGNDVEVFLCRCLWTRVRPCTLEWCWSDRRVSLQAVPLCCLECRSMNCLKTLVGSCPETSKALLTHTDTRAQTHQRCSQKVISLHIFFLIYIFSILCITEYVILEDRSANVHRIVASRNLSALGSTLKLNPKYGWNGFNSHSFFWTCFRPWFSNHRKYS